ncbi:AI-2E family transporter [Halovivax cerinus]|uniref:AI-2E family transporter n=1 Tax=Halovivax cerinus TaxID=1487865 RepID=A0ABD5NMU8_9EURY|nr:AI-2E family transporter [Halovivax cerinus]
MRLDRGFLLALALVFVVLTVLVVVPFLQYVLGAVLLAYALYPVQRRLERRVSSATAALTLVSVTIVGLVAPFVVVLSTIAADAGRVVEDLDAESIRLDTLETRLEAVTGREIALDGSLVGSSQDLAMTTIERSTAAFSSLATFLIGIVLALFLLYYLLKDADVLVDWLYRTVPLPDAVQRDLYDEFSDLLWAVLFGHVFVGVVQGVVAGIGFYAVGIPNAAFWTVVMIVFAMVPLIGTIPIWGGAVIYLLLLEQPVFAAALFVYSVVVVGVTDDYLRPFAVDRYAELNPAVILLGILGGAAAFGIMGLFYGPVVVGGLKAILEVIGDHWDHLDDAAG